MPERLVLGRSSVGLGGQETTGLGGASSPRVSEAGLGLLNELLRGYFDACAADPDAERCPFAPPSGAENIEIEPDAEWAITSYPEVVVEMWESVGDAQALSTARPGSAEVEATKMQPGGGARETTLSCPLLVEGLQASFLYEGGVELGIGPTAPRECASMVEAE